MRFDYTVPGVYTQDVVLKPAPGLLTGVPGFVGFLDPKAQRDLLFQRPLASGPGGAALPYQPLALQRRDEFAARFEGGPVGYLSDVVTAFFMNGGTRCYVVFAEYNDRSNERAVASLTKALDALAALDDLDLVAVPDVQALRLPDGGVDFDSITRAQRAVLEHCAAQGDRFAVLDALPAQTPQGVLKQRDALTRGVAEPVNGALYYPWLKVSQSLPGAGTAADSHEGAVKLVPPCGHVAAVYARSDARVGVHKAPANEELAGVVDLESPVTDAVQGELNPAGVNCLRAFPGRGIRVWGARTLSRDPQWRYVNVRRLFITLARWVELSMGWAALEPNTPALWVHIRRELDAYLSKLWQAGALVGQTPEQAYYVKCDSDTNPPEAREAGRVVTEVGLATSAPAEYVVVRITHRIGAEPR
jgi:hypothetical protein